MKLPTGIAKHHAFVQAVTNIYAVASGRKHFDFLSPEEHGFNLDEGEQFAILNTQSTQSHVIEQLTKRMRPSEACKYVRRQTKRSLRSIENYDVRVLSTNTPSDEMVPSIDLLRVVIVMDGSRRRFIGIFKDSSVIL